MVSVQQRVAPAAVRWAPTILVALLGTLLVWVLFEAWVQVLLATPVQDARGNLVADAPEWPKTVKNALYLAVLAVTVVKVAMERRWREFRTPADIALVVLGAVLVLSGLLGDSPARLTAEAAYVYLRGAIVFYAWRAADPSGRQVRRVLAVVAGIVGLNALLAIVQTVVGQPAYEGLGWINMTWAGINRAHALLDHPNHLGHLLAMAMLGLLAWMVTRPLSSRTTWAAFTGLALALSATQSRESTIGFVAGVAVICVLRRGGGAPQPWPLPWCSASPAPNSPSARRTGPSCPAGSPGCSARCTCPAAPRATTPAWRPARTAPTTRRRSPSARSASCTPSRAASCG
ncbi:hypothetical protein [Phytohabitans rumicis]|uniref:Uncharacterized protein n=1 Tax=Phytohabitans rumicis TaxID=1076125 RepID=A0A6V8LIF1_9ACTN|nr:hypothetical protein [Phytohabitans rumicis]GFJ94628.1 hypothetical protein Prum_082700 [Phytohabitans rumicis]